MTVDYGPDTNDPAERESDPVGPPPALPDEMKLDDFIKANGITLEIEGGVDPRHLRAMKTVTEKDGDREWEHYLWNVTLLRSNERFSTPYRTGTGHSTRAWSDFVGGGSWIVTPTPPKVDMVLDSLRSDAETYDNARDFEDFAASLGYDEDSRKAEAIYRACGETAKKLRFFLTPSLYQQLIDEVERL